MSAGCHAAPRTAADPDAFHIALAGNPNVGKSTVFNSLTGQDVLTANYPGTSVEVTMASVRADGHRLTLLDLPGTYALSGRTGDQQAARRALLDDPPDVVVAVLDATNLARNLYLVLQLLDLGLPLVVALNLSDEATKRGIHIDARRLSELLGAPVVPTIATRRCGITELLAEAQRLIGQTFEPRHRYGAHVEHLAALVGAHLNGTGPQGSGRAGAARVLPARGRALLALEEANDGTLGADGLHEALVGAEDMAAAALVVRRAAARSLEPLAVVVARERHVLAERMAREVTRKAGEVPRRRLWRLATRPVTGVPILGLVLGGLFAGLFWGGSLLAKVVETVWSQTASPVIGAVLRFAFGEGLVTKTLLWGLDAGLLAILTIGIPYVLTFYVLLSVLEDTGYLNAASVLLDRLLSRLGLNGRAAIPLVAGAGCSVPAILGLRVLRTERERLIGGTLVALTPCSARTAVIMGALAYMGGWRVALALYGVVALLIAVVGWGFNRLVPGRPPDLLIEIFPFRWPHLRTVLRKAWVRGREFVTVAVPIVLAGSVVLGALYETGLIRFAARPLSPVVEGWLGLPAVAGLTLVFAVLRKELALQLLVALAIVQYGAGAENLSSFMTPAQLFTYALVNTIYIPCVATIAVLGRVFGWRRAALISAFTITLALVVGGTTIRLLSALGFG